MEVQVTKDIGGVVIWKPGVKIAYHELRGTAPGDPSRVVVKDLRWRSQRFFPWTPELFDYKDTKKHFPELKDMLDVGERKVMKLAVLPKED